MASGGLVGLVQRVGRRRKPEPVVVTVVLLSGEVHRLPDDSAIAKAMGQVAGFLAHW